MAFEVVWVLEQALVTPAKLTTSIDTQVRIRSVFIRVHLHLGRPV